MKLSLLLIFLNSFLKSKVTRFLSKMLRASAITMEGTKITLSPCSHFSNIADALRLNLGLAVNHHKSACVSATKFMDDYIPVLLYKDRFAEAMSSSVISTPFRTPLREIIFFPVGVICLRRNNFKPLISFSMDSILWSTFAELFAAACSIFTVSFIKIVLLKSNICRSFCQKKRVEEAAAASFTYLHLSDKNG